MSDLVDVYHTYGNLYPFMSNSALYGPGMITKKKESEVSPFSQPIQVGPDAHFVVMFICGKGGVEVRGSILSNANVRAVSCAGRP